GDEWEDHSLMFTTKKGTPIEPRNINRLLDVLCTKAGVRRIRFHDLRHTFATLLYEHGVTVDEIQDVLGHSSPAITKTVYIRPSRQAPPKTANKVGFLFSKPTLGSALGSNPSLKTPEGLPAEANNPSELSQHSARSEGFEPPTF
ncbi:MAG TPA: tyrosine-type recombinase/integrase, partial [Mycobacteriales bacterium]|nr:tyrosine-type recombinase/integrase [Mycobacteriales bacterium]